MILSIFQPIRLAACPQQSGKTLHALPYVFFTFPVPVQN